MKKTGFFIVLVLLLIVVCFGYKDIPLDKLKEKYANTASKFISVNGMDIHYRDEGIANDSLPIVLIHGTGASLHTFNAWTEDLKKEHRVIRMDLPAFGLTGPFPDRDYAIKNYVQFIENFLSALHVNKCILAGNSLGGKIAWSYTLENPKKVDKLILIDALSYPTEARSVPLAFTLAKIPILNKALTFITPKFMAKSSVENVYANKTKVTDALVEQYFELLLRPGNRQAFVDRIMQENTSDSYKKISTIKTPTLILWGKEDLLIPVSNAYKLKRDLSNSSLVILDQTGHVPMEESPKKSLQAIKDFLGLRHTKHY
ncbi:alpha/beta fold hydrolase [Lacinutrix cladophorae]